MSAPPVENGPAGEVGQQGSLLFDLPLDARPRRKRRRSEAKAAEAVTAQVEVSPRPAPPPEDGRPLSHRTASRSSRRVDLDGPLSEPAAPVEPRPTATPTLRVTRHRDEPDQLAARARAGGADILLHVALILLVGSGLALLGVAPRPGIVLPVAIFVGVFSLVYTMVPLALWGYTPGMAWAGLVARHHDGTALGFTAAGGRWLGGLLTVTLAGLPMLFGSPTLADRFSRSRLATLDSDQTTPFD